MFVVVNEVARKWYGVGAFDIPDGLAVRIPGFHPGGPGSTPGQGARLFPPPLSILTTWSILHMHVQMHVKYSIILIEYSGMRP